MLTTFDSDLQDPLDVGGKAFALTRLRHAGLPVPYGVVLGTDLYRILELEVNFDSVIEELATPVLANRTLSFRNGSQKIQQFFLDTPLPSLVSGRIEQASEYFPPDLPLAVRSSATGEDSADASFAGLYSSFLNVIGVEALIASVRRCWASLWSERAMAYRYRLGITHKKIEMAVILQEMVQAEVSGVAFTADPSNGDRSKLLINANSGLGENIVGGTVNPDLVVLNKDSLHVIGSEIQCTPHEATNTAPDRATDRAFEDSVRDEFPLTPSKLAELAELALYAEEELLVRPQDVEWAMANGKVHLLQSRPITNLPPVPLTNIKWEASEENALLLRHQLVEHIPGPVSRLFEETFLTVALQESWGRNLAKNYRSVYNYEHTQPPWSFVVHPTVNGYAYKRVGTPKKPPHRALPKLPPKGLKRRFLIWRNSLRQRQRWKRRWLNDALPKYVSCIERWDLVDESNLSNQELVDGIWELARGEADHWFNGSYFGMALVRNHEIRLNQFFEKYSSNTEFSSSQLLAGFDTMTQKAQRHLFDIARAIRSNEDLLDRVLKYGPTELESVLKSDSSSEPQQSVCDYIERYGKQIFSLDFAEPAPFESTSTVYQGLFALIVDKGYDYHQQQAALNTRRESAIRQTAKHFTLWKRMRFYRLLRRAERDYHLRDKAQSKLGQAWPSLRRLALELGQRLRNQEALEKREDVFHLTTEEISHALDALTGETVDAKAIRQRARYFRELRESRRVLNPPMRIGSHPDFPQPEKARSQHSNVLQGSAVSPGIVTATACVLSSPESASEMVPGAVLVCPTTTPAWTPLLTQASALVTDIGGLLAHGSIIAREFGIPAVLGLGDATRKIQTGDLLTVDGNVGTVQVLSVASTDPTEQANLSH